MGLDLCEMHQPWSWSEDFGVLAKTYGGGVFFGIGAGVDQPELHAEGYDFPDELLEPLALMWLQVVARG